MFHEKIFLWNKWFSFFLFLLPLARMKKNKLIVSLSLIVTVLFSMLFQSLHTYEHLEKQLSQKQCHHKYNVTGKEITHQHKKVDHCYVCEFAFGSYITPKNFSYQWYSCSEEIPYFFTGTETVISFSGSLYSHRGPPVNNLSWIYFSFCWNHFSFSWIYFPCNFITLILLE